MRDKIIIIIMREPKLKTTVEKEKNGKERN